AMVTYTGIETISNLSEEAKDPGRNVPKATWWVIIAVLFVSAFLPTIGISVFPVSYDNNLHAYTTQLATAWKADPVAGIVTGFQEPLRLWAQVWVGILAFTILVIATNAGLIGISRLSYSMAGVDLLPHRLARLHPKVKFGRDSIPVLSLVGALFIGTVFTQLVFQNISNSTFIFMAWLLLGVLVYLLYRRYRHEPLWEPLEVPPIREREFEHVPFESQ